MTPRKATMTCSGPATARAGRQPDVAGGQARAGPLAGDAQLEVLGQRRGVGRDRQRHRLLVDQGVGRGLAGQLHRDLHGHLLALADRDQVDVLQVALDRVAHDALRQGQLVALLGLQRQQRVGVVLEGQHQLVARQREVRGASPCP
jgi:hypothetical protein